MTARSPASVRVTAHFRGGGLESAEACWAGTATDDLLNDYVLHLSRPLRDLVRVECNVLPARSRLVVRGRPEGDPQ